MGACNSIPIDASLALAEIGLRRGASLGHHCLPEFSLRNKWCNCNNCIV